MDTNTREFYFGPRRGDETAADVRRRNEAGRRSMASEAFVASRRANEANKRRAREARAENN